MKKITGRLRLKKKNTKLKTFIFVIILIMIAILSASVMTNYAVNPQNHAKTIAALDEKKKTVLELSAASAGISAAITLLPNDTGNAIAEKLMGLSSYFLIILCAIFLEKYLVTITGYAAFRVLIPITCILLALWLVIRKDTLMKLALKSFLFAVTLYVLVPMSVDVSGIIENTYESSIETTIQSAKDTARDIEANEDATDEKSDKGILSGLISKVKDSVTGITDKVGNILNNFIEAVAVFIVTVCIIPILVLIFFLWIIKSLLGINFDIPNMSKFKRDIDEETLIRGE